MHGNGKAVTERHYSRDIKKIIYQSNLGIILSPL